MGSLTEAAPPSHSEEHSIYSCTLISHPDTYTPGGTHSLVHKVTR